MPSRRDFWPFAVLGGVAVALTGVITLALVAACYGGGQPIPDRLAAVCARQGLVATCTPRINRTVTLTIQIGVDDATVGAGRVGWVQVYRGRKLIAAKSYGATSSESPCLSFPCLASRAWGGEYVGVVAADLTDLAAVEAELPWQLGEPQLAEQARVALGLDGEATILDVRRVRRVDRGVGPVVVEARVRVGWLR